jgi:hypothetical protein
VQERFDRRVVRIDTGMLAEYYGGRASALVLEGDQAAVVYAGDGISTPVPQPRMLGSRPGAMSDDELESFLREAEVSSRAERDGLAVLRLRRGNIELGTVFRPATERGFAPEVAAYQLDRMLELGMVPVTVERVIDGIEGSVQFIPDRTFTEAQRRENGLGGGAWCPLVDQYEAMYIFDSLIFNTYRTADRILLNESDLRVLLIGHERAFTTDRGRPAYLAPVQLHITPSWREKLEALDAATLGERFGNLLDRRRIRALLARRDALLAGT